MRLRFFTEHDNIQPNLIPSFIKMLARTVIIYSYRWYTGLDEKGHLVDAISWCCSLIHWWILRENGLVGRSSDQEIVWHLERYWKLSTLQSLWIIKSRMVKKKKNPRVSDWIVWHLERYRKVSPLQSDWIIKVRWFKTPSPSLLPHLGIASSWRR